jgi:hypothetical protein
VNSKGKYILYLFYNKLEDLAFKLLNNMNFIELEQLKQTFLWGEIKLCVLKGIKKSHLLPRDSYNRAKNDFTKIFGEEFPEMHNYFENSILNP